MRRRLFLVLAVVCIAAVFAGVFAGCNNDGKGGEGAKIFTEGASYEDVCNALAKAESYQFVNTIKYTSDKESYTATYTNTFTSDFGHFNVVVVYSSEPDYYYDYYIFTDGEYFYQISIENSGGDKTVTAEKQFAEYMSAEDHFVSADEALYEMGIVEKDGGLAVDEEMGSGVYMRCEGSALYVVIPDSGVDEEGGEYEGQVEYCMRGVNAKYSLPDEIKAMKADAVWAESVEYNDVIYQKAEDEQGEYYYVYHKYDASAVPEKTINGLPVRERA